MTVLVTGGAGYIGSHTVHALLDRGDKVVVLDNLSTGVRAQVGAAAAFVEGDIADRDRVRALIADHGVTSLSRLGIAATMAEVDTALRVTFAEVFEAPSNPRVTLPFPDGRERIAKITGHIAKSDL